MSPANKNRETPSGHRDLSTNVQPMKTISINGVQEKVLDFVPDIQKDRLKVIVDAQTFTRVATLLPSVSFYNIKDKLSDEVLKQKDLESLLELLEREILFHETMNLAKTYAGNNDTYNVVDKSTDLSV